MRHAIKRIQEENIPEEKRRRNKVSAAQVEEE
jgi:hypothetical protein